MGPVGGPDGEGQQDDAHQAEVEAPPPGEVAAHGGDLPAVRAAGQSVVHRVELKKKRGCEMQDLKFGLKETGLKYNFMLQIWPKNRISYAENLA